VEYLTPKHEIPEYKMMANDELIHVNNPDWQSPPNAYALNIGLIGPVNSGKS
jgi:polynucleotide 5'-kinase involved in rRNA processing